MNNDSSVENKLSTLKYNTSDVTHLIVNQEKCKKCKTKECLYVCPAKVYSYENDEMKVEYENCLECGACRMICPHDAIEWQYPKSSKGVIYKLS